MSSLVKCPHCGSRPREEFTVRGEVATPRPVAGADESIWFDHVYLRDNPRGQHREYWHHSGGCRRWLVLDRNTVTHETSNVVDASTLKAEGRA
ncbi:MULTISPECIES: sarcosine oxidase subunit delta [Thalassospira]|jgi:sarcosine oxidase subunit delta|uniref:Sarcosine oxidase subunit delta n=2 Tax=Thalassospira TaxID=168934 RepID=A0A367W0Y6_9PROT|nr:MULTISPECIES: sarcosine oxidase subunit delta [Thalassospira]MDG4720174.1 sarcosine oxidase subunit delta [Thalassospira sp. FZY0004]RCK33030.1 sarcosine oxidase subunit delta [Thalassospira profundimaris]